jgi:energy-coupling factor transporter ATP-binding protein EcfA2
VALARVESLTYAYPGVERPALSGVSLELRAGEAVALLGPSGSGKSTLLRALAALVPHFHGGRFAGRVEVAGLDTRHARPAELAGVVATVFQDPEDQVVMTRVANEAAFGLENLGVPAGEIRPRADEALAAVGALHLSGRRTTDLSGGELQRVCLAGALAVRPQLLLLDEPTSQLDPDGAEEFLRRVEELGASVVLSEHRTGGALELCARVLFLEKGRLLLDAPREEALEWLAERRPAYLAGAGLDLPEPATHGDTALRLQSVGFAYEPGLAVLDGLDLEARRGELLVLEGPNGSGKTTVAKLAAGLLQPDRGTVTRPGRAAYLSQDPGRYLACELAIEEAALAVGGDHERARAALELVGLAWAADRHPRDLSSGERERLGLAAVAVAEPDLLVLDEPTRGIDPERKADLARWLHSYAAGGRAVLIATHDRGFPAHRRITIGEELVVAA